MRRVGGQQEHVALADDDVAKGRAVDDLEHHGAAVLVEPLGGLVDVVVGAGVGAADDLGVLVEGLRIDDGISSIWRKTCHDCKVIVVDAVVADGRLEQVGVFLEPGMMKTHMLAIALTWF